MAEIARLRSLLAEATPGPWAVTVGGMVKQCGGGVVFMRNDLRGPRADCNAELVAEAINALPALLALAEAVPELMKTLHIQTFTAYQDCDNCNDMHNAALDAIKRYGCLVALPDGGEVE